MYKIKSGGLLLEILSNHLRSNCDPGLAGVLSLSVKEAYRFLDDLVEREKILKHKDMKKTLGHLRHGLIDVALKQVLQSSSIPHEIADESSSKYRNGHTYLMIETKGAIITPAKVFKSRDVPKKAIYRSKGGLLNKQYNLFEEPADINAQYDESNPPFLLLTYGGLNHKLEFVTLGLPNVGVLGWIDQVNITNAPVLLINQEEVSNDLQLTFTSEAEKIIMRGVDNGGKEGAI